MEDILGTDSVNYAQIGQNCTVLLKNVINN